MLIVKSGIRALRDASAGHFKVQLGEVKLGLSAAYTPLRSHTGLQGSEVHSSDISSINVLSDNSIEIQLILPSETGSWEFNEIGVFLDNGNLFSLASLPDKVRNIGNGEYQEIYKPNDFSTSNFTISFRGQTTDALAHNVSTADLKTALASLDDISSLSVLGTGTEADKWVVSFTDNAKEDSPSPALIATNGVRVRNEGYQIGNQFDYRIRLNYSGIASILHADYLNLRFIPRLQRYEDLPLPSSDRLKFNAYLVDQVNEYDRSALVHLHQIADAENPALTRKKWIVENYSNRIRTGVVTTASTTSITDPALKTLPDWFDRDENNPVERKALIQFTSGDYQGMIKEVTDYDHNTGTVSWDGDLKETTYTEVGKGVYDLTENDSNQTPQIRAGVAGRYAFSPIGTLRAVLDGLSWRGLTNTVARRRSLFISNAGSEGYGNERRIRIKDGEPRGKFKLSYSGQETDFIPFSGIQTVTRPSGTSGTFTLRYGGTGLEHTSNAIAHNATAAQVKTAITGSGGITAITAADVEIVSVDDGGTRKWTVSFLKAESNMAAFTVDNTGITGNDVIVTRKTSAEYIKYRLEELSNITAVEVVGNGTEASPWTVAFGTQRIGIESGFIGDEFTLKYNPASGAEQTTNPIPRNASSGIVQRELKQLRAIRDIEVTGNDGGPWAVRIKDPALKIQTIASDTAGISITPDQPYAERNPLMARSHAVKRDNDGNLIDDDGDRIPDGGDPILKRDDYGPVPNVIVDGDHNKMWVDAEVGDIITWQESESRWMRFRIQKETRPPDGHPEDLFRAWTRVHVDLIDFNNSEGNRNLDVEPRKVEFKIERPQSQSVQPSAGDSYEVLTSTFEVDKFYGQARSNLLKNHEDIEVSAGQGLEGGGKIDANRELRLRVDRLTPATPAEQDYMPYYDVVSGLNRKASVAAVKRALGQSGIRHVRTKEFRVRRNPVWSFYRSTTSNYQVKYGDEWTSPDISPDGNLLTNLQNGLRAMTNGRQTFRDLYGEGSVIVRKSHPDADHGPNFALIEFVDVHSDIFRPAGATGSFKLTYGGQTTANIRHDATDDGMRTALESLSNIGLGNIGVSMVETSSGRTWSVSFKRSGFNEDFDVVNTGMSGGDVTANRKFSTPRNLELKDVPRHYYGIYLRSNWISRHSVERGNVYESSFTYQKPKGLIAAFVVITGAGGSGGYLSGRYGVASLDGGSAGGTAIKFFRDEDIPDSVAINVGVAEDPYSVRNFARGGSTIMHTGNNSENEETQLLRATGGLNPFPGGALSQSQRAGRGYNGDFNLRGEPGWPRRWRNPRRGGTGGASFWGRPGVGVTVHRVTYTDPLPAYPLYERGGAAWGPGSGGAGAVNRPRQWSGTQWWGWHGVGGYGGDGICVILEITDPLSKDFNLPINWRQP